MTRMNSIEKQLLDRYSEKEETKSFYEAVQKVIPNPCKMKLEERSSVIVLTENGPERRNYYRGRTRRFLSNRGL